MTQLSRRASFWTAAAVLTLCLWASAAPSMVYPVYAAQWGLSPAVTTAVFATYPIILVITLVAFGNISDHIGRRNTILIGLGFLLVGALSFALAPDPSWLFVGRALQGIGVAFSVGAASAALVDYNPTTNAALPGSLNTMSQSLGLVLCTLLGGTLIVFAPAPLHLSYWLLVVLIVAVGTLTLFFPPISSENRDDNPWRPQGLRVPRSLIPIYLVSALAVTAAFAMGAIFLSLGAQIARDVVGTNNVVLIGAVLSISYLFIGATALVASRLRPRISVLGGAVAGIVGLALVVLSAEWRSLTVFIAAAIICGIGYGLSMSGGIGLASTNVSAHHRARLLSAVFLAAYLVQGVIAFSAGLTATHTGLQHAVAVIAPLIAGLFVATLIAATVVRNRRPAPAIDVLAAGHRPSR